jgi:meso-butanediol dehydrogenase/(S,S)-butanediol dehydrogenase/diacetyl reductase
VIALTRQLAAEGARHGIRVNCISPGMILSPATSEPIFENPEHPMYRIRDHIPFGRVEEPEDIARCGLFLASDDSSYMTAANLVLDGGWSVGTQRWGVKVRWRCAAKQDLRLVMALR